MPVVKVNFAQTLKQAQEQARIKAAAAQKPRITAQELEALTLITNNVSNAFVHLIQENPEEEEAWSLALSTPLHFDDRLIKGLELVSKEYPEVSFTLLDPHTLVFTLERSAIESLEQSEEGEKDQTEQPTHVYASPKFAQQILRALLNQG